MSLQSTLGDVEWLKENESFLKGLFPETWTHVSNINGLKLMYQFKLKGIDWRSTDDLQSVLTYLYKIGVIDIKINQYLVKRSNSSIFKGVNNGAKDR